MLFCQLQTETNPKQSVEKMTINPLVPKLILVSRTLYWVALDISGLTTTTFPNRQDAMYCKVVLKCKHLSYLKHTTGKEKAKVVFHEYNLSLRRTNILSLT